MVLLGTYLKEQVPMAHNANISRFRGIVPFFVLFLVLAGTAFKPAESRESDYFAIARNIDLLGEVYSNVSENYVDSVNVAEFMYAGIDGMLETLDPYTVFLDEKESVELGELTRGQYAGVGIRIGEIAGDVFVVSVIEGAPAAEAGLRVGDRIVKVQRQDVEGKELEKVKNLIKGPPGSSVTLSVKRYGRKSTIRFSLTRQEVRVNSIRYAGLIGRIGYFEMNSFGNRSADELGKAIHELQVASKIRNQPMNGVILDLRNNPGGLLDVAVDVSGLFLDKGSRVVSTRGRYRESEVFYKTQRDPVVRGLPIAVLINNNSASASEIVAGAIQELDRGVIIGERSYGKGLVQSVINLPYDCTLKLTTAKYYTPSGRLIQKQHGWTGGVRTVTGEKGALENKKAFYTLNRRKVYGGGGILPDILIKEVRKTGYEAALRKEGMIFRYANKYKASNDSLPPAGIDQTALLADFREFLESEKFMYRTEPELLLDNVRKTLADQQGGDAAKISALVDSLENEMKLLAGKQMQTESEKIALVLKEEVIRHFNEEAARKIMVERDPVVQKALDILQDSSKYRKTLSP